MTKKKKIMYLIFFISLDVFLLYGFLTIHNATMLNYIRKEVSKLESKDLASDSFSYKVVTMGGYATVEKAIKSYLYDYSSLLKETNDIVIDDKLKKVLSYDNYQNDGPLFNESFLYLEDRKETFNKNIDILISKCDKDRIKNNINNKSNISYFKNLYNELFVTDHFIGEFKDNKSLLIATKEKMNNIYNTCLETLNYLSSEKDNWVIEDGEIKFQTKEMYDKYMNLISKVK